MAELGPNRVLVEDVRRDGSFLRITWHPEKGAFVVSNWEGTVCTGATRIAPEAVPELVSLLVRGLAEDAASAGTRSGAQPARRSARDRWDRWLERLAPRLGDHARLLRGRFSVRAPGSSASDADLMPTLPWRQDEDRSAV